MQVRVCDVRIDRSTQKHNARDQRLFSIAFNKEVEISSSQTFIRQHGSLTGLTLKTFSKPREEAATAIFL